MPRLISFGLTQQQIADRVKTVTRRLGWGDLKAGTELRGVDRVMGFRKGQRPVDLCRIHVVDVRREPLARMVEDLEYGRREVVLEGFAGLSPDEFVAMFCRHMRCDRDRCITRIAFEFVDDSSVRL